MALGDEIRQLADRSLAALDSSHDYYTFTRRVWRLLGVNIQTGLKLKWRNVTTGSVVNEQVLVERWQNYDTEYLTSSTFQHFVSLFEGFFFDLLRLWLTAYPGSLSKKTLEFGTVLKATDKSVIVLLVVDKELNDLKYERLADWFAYLQRLTRIDGPAQHEIEQMAEIKATRDLLVHNQGIVNATYLEKSKSCARFQVGDRLELPEPYHRASWELIKKVVRGITDAALSKVAVSA